MTSKGSITEEDISTLLQRYSATTVLSLLQEVANFPSPKIDWEALVKKSSTGITNAREYQMLWRHLAYRDSLLDKVDDGAQPLDDESDLESELEVVPPVDNEASVEAAACVKVLMASGIPSESNLPNGSTADAPLTINIPNGQASKVLSESSQQAVIHGTNITVPISVQKQSFPNMSSADGSEATGLASSSLANKRKRKPWSKAEDLDLIAAVQKCGEGNWANILKGEFKGDRTASQLSQRWNIIRKRQGNANAKGSTSIGTQPNPAFLAARHAMSLALAMPVKNLTSGAGGATSSNALANSLLSTTAATTGSSVVGSSTVQEQQSQQVPVPSKSSIGESSCVTAKSRLPSKKSPPKANMSPDSMGLKAAAVAAGARIATPSDAASILMAAQAKNAVHVITTGGSIVKGSVPGGTVHSGVHSNVHYIRTGLATPPVSSQSTAISGASPSVPVKAIPHSTQRAPLAPGIASSSSSQQTDAVASTSSAEVQFKQEVKSEEEIKFQKMNNMPKHTVQEDGSNQVRGHLAPTLRGETTNLITVNNSNHLTDLQLVDKEQGIVSRDRVNGQNANSDQISCSPSREDENDALAKEKYGDATIDKQESVSHSVVADKEIEIVKVEAGVTRGF